MAASKLSWARPAGIEYPKTWNTFKAKRLDSNELVEYQIRDLTADRFDEAFHLISTDYLRNKPMNQALSKDPPCQLTFSMLKTQK